MTKLTTSLSFSRMPGTPTVIKRIKGRDKFWLFVRQLGISPQRFNQIEDIQVRELEIDDEDILSWFLHSAFSNPHLPNLKRAILYMDDLEVSMFNSISLSCCEVLITPYSFNSL